MTFTSHGDMLYLLVKDSADGALEEPNKQTVDITEDPIDVILRKKDGKIYRKKDPQL